MKEHIDLADDPSSCCGCGACAVICPKSAITMEEDECGYIYPVIDSNKCIKCGKCLNNCSYKKESKWKNKPLIGYAAINTNDKMYGKSASGGVFSAIAASFISSGAHICGAAEIMTDDLYTVRHVIGNDVATLKKIQGSKYVQSDAYMSFGEIINLLNSGQKVLFSGTPCQVDALKTITGNPDNLYTIDLICHGVPSQKMFNEFLGQLKKDLNAKISRFVFRFKSKNTKEFNAAVYCVKYYYLIPHALLSYYKLFLDGVIYRKNCYSCPYACEMRVADITIGDFWGIEEQHSDDVNEGRIDLSKCWSGLLVNTDKGEELLRENLEFLNIVSSDYSKIAAKNKQLRVPSQEPDERDHILSIYRSEGYRGVERQFRKKMGGPIKFLIKRMIYIKKYKSGDDNEF
ncbi:Coenzyme F420 hydrogenase/dehydrogenase, beta subunit C-terminal domain [Butyrivibrio sp. AE3006]|uniref:Coenzyme F420 hydrogenase/dehydrogenase, beta subunit C-terminal domain n=1 Tax=Butyrivibrio sp. AE3006 TaxID=1280673 RepID=UPI00040BA721|nr:Coenzyme F420 hydrogenase/dehydrogenase, beta subunit C-terminal domain [Butyrivibrio sp. AE3006]